MIGNIDNSFIFVDKPPNMLSHETTSWVGRILGAKKAGHIGTLDPKVTGVLIVGLGKATKLITFFSGMKKEYVAIMDWKKDVTEKYALGKFAEFRGEITQTPPEMSAVAKRPRKRTVYEIELIEHNGRFSVFRTLVDAGTYIRTLCNDMGGEMKDLRRISSGPVSEKDTFIMQKIVDAANLAKKGKTNELGRMLVSPERMVELFGICRVLINKKAALSIANGALLAVPGITKAGKFSKGDYVAMFLGKKLVGVGQALMDSTEILKSKNGLAVKPMRISAGKEELAEG
jgi:H/ACA ribonucleoprotein complex subunit 4